MSKEFEELINKVIKEKEKQAKNNENGFDFGLYSLKAVRELSEFYQSEEGKRVIGEESYLQSNPDFKLIKASLMADIIHIEDLSRRIPCLVKEEILIDAIKLTMDFMYMRGYQQAKIEKMVNNDESDKSNS